MNLALVASRVSCVGKLGCVHQKLLTVICGPISTYTYHLNISDVDFLYETGFYWTILLSEYWIHGTFLLSSRYIGFQSHLQRRINICIWIIPLTENISWILHTIYLLADLIILLWWVHANANLILMVHLRFLLHPDKIFPISLQSAGNFHSV